MVRPGLFFFTGGGSMAGLRWQRLLPDDSVPSDFRVLLHGEPPQRVGEHDDGQRRVWEVYVHDGDDDQSRPVFRFRPASEPNSSGGPSPWHTVRPAADGPGVDHGAMEVFDPVHLDGVLELCCAEGWPTYPADPDRARRALTAPGTITLVELDRNDSGVVGFAHGFGDGVTAYLAQLLVDPGHRGRGLARGLLAEFAARAGSPTRVDLLTTTAAGLYTRFPHQRYEGFRLDLST